MKKNLLFSMALCASLSGWAQTSYETALPLQEGENTYTCEESVQNLYWKYTPTEDMIVRVKPTGYNMVEMHTSVTEGEETSMKAINFAAFQYPERGFALRAGSTYYVVLTPYNTPGTISFNYSICTNSAGVGTGLTAEDPLVIIPGKEQFIGATYAENEEKTTYATYTATVDGLLKIKSPSYVSYFSVNEDYLSFDSNNDVYVASIPVTSGETYNFKFKGYNAYFLTSELVQPTAGSIDMPFEMQTGANTVPAEAGEYWYSVTPVGTGYFTLSSESSLPGGKVELFYSKSAYSAYATAEGNYNLRYDLNYNSGNTMYVKVTKPEASAEPDILTYEMKDYAQGEKEDNPLPIATVPGEVKVPAQTSYYFSLTTPAEQTGFLVVEVLEALANEDTYVNVYPKGNNWSGSRGTNVTKLEIEGGTEYTILCSNQEQNELTLKVSYAAIQDGDIITQPLTAKLGENSINGKGIRYYTYKASKACKVQVTVPEGVVVSFPKDASEYNTYDAYVNGQTTTLYAEGAQSYYIKLENCTGEGSFAIAEADYVAGDTKEQAIEVTDGVYTFGEEVPSCLWIKYTAAKAGKLAISSQIPFDYTSTSMLLWTDNSKYGNQLVDYENYTYGGSINVSENQNIYIQILSTISLNGQSLNFDLKDPEPGEIPATAIDGTNGRVAVPATGYDKEFWVKVDAKAGTLILKSTGSASGLLYQGLENAVNDKSREYITCSNYDYSEGIMLDEYVYDTELQEADTYYIKFMYIYSPIEVWFEGDIATAINGIESQTQQGAEEVYDFRGMKLNGKSLKKGLYIIKKDGKSQKMLVK
ncbi:MAG: hypothetical protein ACI3YM_08475 [Prevotella sp.]